MPHLYPKLIVVTPVRNEAWVLEAFLTHCSSWADRIIIADQHSTDGSREIALRFPKVTLIDNPLEEMNMAAARKLLFSEVDKLDGDKIVFTMDADEFLSEGFDRTEDWRSILQSTPDSIFCYRWMDMEGDYSHVIDKKMHPFEWTVHFRPSTKLEELYGIHEQHIVHEARVPCTPTARYINLDNIRFVHLGRLNSARTLNKTTLYQILTLNRKVSPISIYRQYHAKINTYLLPTPVRLTTLGGEDITHLVRTADHGQHYIDEIVAILRREGCRKFASLCIWDNPDLVAAGIHYRPPLRFRLLHRYLRATQPHRQRLAVRIVDKVLKAIF